MPKKNSGAKLEWRKERKLWEIVWYERGQRRRKSTGEGSRTEAEKRLADHILTAGRENIGPSDPSQRLIGDVLADYLLEKGAHVSSKKTLSHAVDELTVFFGEKPVSVVREATCRAYMKHREQLFKMRQEKTFRQRVAAYNKRVEQYPGHGPRPKPLGYTLQDIPGKVRQLSPGMVRRELTVLSAAINHDYKAGRLTAPVHVWKPVAVSYKDRWLTRQEAARMIREARNGLARDHLPLFLMIGLYTGARKEAILSLRWAMIDMDKGLIDFNPPGRARTSKGRPIVPIPRKLMTILRYARKRGTATGFVIQRNQKPIKDIKHGFEMAAQRAGIENVTPHTLRHTAATWMTQKGVPFPVIARYLGHRNSRTTEEIYAHHAPDYLRAASESFG